MVKVGVRKPSVKRSISARTKGRATRAIKSTYTPGYGMKGTGAVKSPKRAAYNYAYKRTTVGVDPLSGVGSSSHSSKRSGASTSHKASAPAGRTPSVSGWVPPEPSPKSAGDVAKDVVGGILAGAVAVLGLLLMLFVAFGVPVLVFLFFRDSLGWFWSLMVAIGAFGLITAVLGSVAG